MMSGLPIRARLTLWYSIVLALCLAAFGATVWLGLRQSLMAARQTELEERMAGLRAVLEEWNEQPGQAAESLGEEVGEFCKALPSGFLVRVLGPANAVLFRSGPARPGRALEREDTLAAKTGKLSFKMAAPLESVDELLRRLGRILLLSIPLALLAASAGGYWLSKRALAPVREMAMAAGSIGSAGLSVRLPVPAAKDELRLLAGMWNEMLERLQGSVERIQRFTSDASHDLRTPLAAIRASAEIALRKNREPEAYRDTLARILQQTDRATALVEDLLALARADSGHADLALAPVDLCSALGGICDGLRPLAQGRNLELRQLLPAAPVWVEADLSALTRVMAILVDNALRNTEAGWILVQLETAEGEAMLSVEDTGSGIASADLPCIFDRFYRGDKSRASVTGGSGLGLAIAKRLVELHGATIAVEPKQAHGARFLIRMPLANPAA